MKLEVRKVVRIDARLHRAVKGLAFSLDMLMEDLLDLIASEMGSQPYVSEALSRLDRFIEAPLYRARLCREDF